MTVFMSNGKPFDAYGTPVNAKAAAETKSAGTDLPSDFPERDLIVGSEFRTLEALKNATDQELLDIDGIGPAKLKAIRAALK